MTVNEFVTKYKKANDVEKAKIFKEIEIKTYVPYAQKAVHSETVLKKNANYENGVLQHSSALRFLTYATSILKLYTNLELNRSAPHEDYDLLKECGAMDAIIIKIGDDVQEFTTVFNMTWEDMLHNENNWRNFVATQIEKISEQTESMLSSKELKELLKTSFKNEMM